MKKVIIKIDHTYYYYALMEAQSFIDFYKKNGYKILNSTIITKKTFWDLKYELHLELDNEIGAPEQQLQKEGNDGR